MGAGATSGFGRPSLSLKPMEMLDLIERLKTNPFDVETHVLWTWSVSEARAETLNVLLLRLSCFRNLEQGAAHEWVQG